MKVQIAPKHDFAAKLKQETFLPFVIDYVKWQKAVRAANAAGAEAPEMPKIPLMSINLDLTTACNFRCTHCIDWDKLNTGVKYDEDELFESLGKLIAEGLRSVILIGGGEPTIHRRFEDMVRFLKEHGIKVGVVTNGARGEVLLKVAPILAKGDWIRLSLDSGKNETFLRMHLPRHKEISLEGICEWVPKIRRANPAVQVGFSFIIVWDNAKREQEVAVISNIDEMVAAAKLAKAHGFSYVSYKPFLTRFADGSEVLEPGVMADTQATLTRITAAIAKAKELETEDFKILESTNLRVLMAGNWRDFTHQPKVCHMMAFRQVLSPLGIFHCPAKRGVENSRVGDGNGFTSARKDDTRRSLFAMLEGFDAAHECREITCLYNSTNWWLERLIAGQDDPAELAALPDRGDYYL